MKRCPALMALMVGVGLALIGPVHADLSADDVMALTRKVRSGVMLMMISDEAGHQIGSGTGFVVSKDGKLVTNQHVINAGPRLVAKSANGKIHRIKGVLLEDKDLDVAVLQLEDGSYPALNLDSGENIANGTPLVMVGNPLGRESTVQQGLVGGYRKVSGGQRWLEIHGAVVMGSLDGNTQFIRSGGLQVATSIGHGSSGSPVFTANAEIIGMIAAGSEDAAGKAVALAVPVDVIRKLVEQANGLEPQPMGGSGR